MRILCWPDEHQFFSVNSQAAPHGASWTFQGSLPVLPLRLQGGRHTGHDAHPFSHKSLPDTMLLSLASLPDGQQRGCKPAAARPFWSVQTGKGKQLNGFNLVN